MNLIARLEFELFNYVVVVQHFSNSTIETDDIYIICRQKFYLKKISHQIQYYLMIYHRVIILAQSPGTNKYTDRISAEG